MASHPANVTQRILLTGATRGIGAAIAALLADRGATVCGVGSSEFDLATAEGPSRAWAAAIGQMGGVDVLINNAGVFEANPIDRDEQAWIAAWERTMAINLLAAAHLSRFAVRDWIGSQSGGRIVNIASRAAHRGDSPEHWHYAASKGGMVAMTKTIARAYAASGIYAFAISPGFTMTGMAEDYVASRGGDKLLADIPLGRVATADEIATIAVFCALDAPPSMTGAVLDANGASYVR